MKILLYLIFVICLNIAAFYLLKTLILVLRKEDIDNDIKKSGIFTLITIGAILISIVTYDSYELKEPAQSLQNINVKANNITNDKKYANFNTKAEYISWVKTSVLTYINNNEAYEDERITPSERKDIMDKVHLDVEAYGITDEEVLMFTDELINETIVELNNSFKKHL